VNTSNPAFSNELFNSFDQSYGYGETRSNAMTVQGTIVKTLVLLAVLTLTGLWSWNATADGNMGIGLLAVSGIGGFVVAMITTFKPSVSPYTAPVYAALEGVLLGAISQFVEQRYGVRYPGIAFQAVTLTLGVLFVMLFVYATGLIKVTDKLKAGIVMATGALCLFYLVAFVLRMFGVQMPMFNAGVGGNPMIAIGFSLFVVGLASLNLLLDFDFIDKGAHAEFPKYMEWYGGFGLMVTLVWLYLEILRLLMKLTDRRS
jgi:uncharacterized YccA/Bax inhibitor family protein